MSAPFLSPTPWRYRDGGGAATIVDGYGQTVAILARGMEPGNGAVMAAAPEAVAALRLIAEKMQCACSVAERNSGHRTDCWMPEIVHVTSVALAKADSQ
jgi:hypothetical protein